MNAFDDDEVAEKLVAEKLAANKLAASNFQCCPSIQQDEENGYDGGDDGDDDGVPVCKRK